MLVPAEEIWWPGPVRGSRWGCGCVPNAPDYLSVSLLGTRTGSERGGRPGRPNWRPSQTVKRGECRGSAVGGGLARHGMAQHPLPPPAAPSPTSCLPVHPRGAGSRCQDRGFPVLLPAACPWFPLRNGEPGATGCSPLQFWLLGPLQRETEAREELSSLQAMFPRAEPHHAGTLLWGCPALSTHSLREGSHPLHAAHGCSLQQVVQQG